MFRFGKKQDESKFKDEDVTTLISAMSSNMAHCISLMNDEYYEKVRRSEVNFLQIVEHLITCSRQTGDELDQLREDNRKLEQALEMLSEKTSNKFLEK